MVRVLLRLKGLDTTQHTNVLLATDEDGLLYPLVKYNGSPKEKGEIVVDLSIDQFRGNGPGLLGPVSREPVDKLWNLLGIFPEEERAATQPEPYRALTQWTLEGMRGRLDQVIKAIILLIPTHAEEAKMLQNAQRVCENLKRQLQG